MNTKFSVGKYRLIETAIVEGVEVVSQRKPVK